MRRSQQIEACIKEIHQQGFDKYHVCKVSNRKLKTIVVLACNRYNLDKEWICKVAQLKVKL